MVGTNHVSGMAEATFVQFCMQVGYIKSQHMEHKSPLKGAWSGSTKQLLGPIDSSEIAKARIVQFCLQVDFIKS